jgi:hypothetical protein
MNGSKSSSSTVYGESCHFEALDVAPSQLEVALERGQEGGEVVARAGVDPDLVPLRGGPRGLRAELGGHAPGLFPVAARDADQARVVGLVVERLLERAELLEQPADLVVGELLLRDPPDRRSDLRAAGVAERRHHHQLVPGRE